MRKRTDNFIEDKAISPNIDESFFKMFKPERTVYNIDDCLVTRTSYETEADEQVKTLQGLMGKQLPDYLDFCFDVIDKDVPVMQYTEYLRELKDFAIKGKTANYKNLNRLFIKTGTSQFVGNVAIIGLKPGKVILINEVFSEDVMIKCVEYDINNLLENYNRVYNKKEVMPNIIKKRPPMI